MHVIIINGSPRVKQHSNTDKIIKAFGNGLVAEGSTYEVYTLSDRSEWEAARTAFATHDNIIMAMPLYVESAPSLFLEFLETLPTKREKSAELSFILQSGFAEGNQLRCGEHFLLSLPEQLGCINGGCLLRGNNFNIRFEDKGDDANRKKVWMKPYEKMGRLYAKNGNFLTREAQRFVGLERFPFLLRIMIHASLKLFDNMRWKKVAKSWSATLPLDNRPY